MSEPGTTHAQCTLIVVRLTESRILGDVLAEAVRDRLLSLYEHSDSAHIVIDMGQVEQLSSAGIRPLLTLSRKVREREGRFLLANLREDVHGVLLVTRLISGNRTAPGAFEDHPDVPAAVASLYQ